MMKISIDNKIKTEAENVLPSIFVVCKESLAKGIVHGCVIDANQEHNVIMDNIQAMLAKSSIANAKDYVIHSYEGFGGIELDKNENIRSICAIARLLNQYGEAPTVVAYNFCNHDIDKVKNLLQDDYIGEYNTSGDFSYQLIHCEYNLPQEFADCIDYEGAADVILNDNIPLLHFICIKHNGRYYIFK